MTHDPGDLPRTGDVPGTGHVPVAGRGTGDGVPPVRGMSLDEGRALYERMAEFRTFEELVGEGVRDSLIHGEMHLAIGQEAVAAGLEPHLAPGDAVVSTHRAHLHALIAGVDPVPLLGEIFERDGGLCGGKGGHMHLFDPSRDFMCTGIVGASAPLALGYALQRKRLAAGSLSVAAMGDGAVNHGTFAESLNLAALWKLPVLFLIEDNGYAISVQRTSSTAGDPARRGDAYGIPTWRCDGTDPQAVSAVAGEAVARIRQGAGPSILIATVYRFRGHYEGDLDHYRSDEERDRMRAERDPLIIWRARLLASGVGAADLDDAAQAARGRVAEWVAQAQAMPWPDPAAAREGVFA